MAYDHIRDEIHAAIRYMKRYERENHSRVVSIWMEPEFGPSNPSFRVTVVRPLSKELVFVGPAAKVEEVHAPPLYINPIRQETLASLCHAPASIAHWMKRLDSRCLMTDLEVVNVYEAPGLVVPLLIADLSERLTDLIEHLDNFRSHVVSNTGWASNGLEKCLNQLRRALSQIAAINRVLADHPEIIRAERFDETPKQITPPIFSDPPTTRHALRTVHHAIEKAKEQARTIRIAMVNGKVPDDIQTLVDESMNKVLLNQVQNASGLKDITTEMIVMGPVDLSGNPFTNAHPLGQVQRLYDQTFAGLSTLAAFAPQADLQARARVKAAHRNEFRL